jgi:hypothetical protein
MRPAGEQFNSGGDFEQAKAGESQDNAETAKAV